MSFPVDNIRSLCKLRGTTLAEMERNLKIGNGSIAKWENSPKSPPYDRLKMIADYLDVSISDLAGEQTKKPTQEGELDKVTKKLFRIIDQSTDEEKKQILDYIEFIKSRR